MATDLLDQRTLNRAVLERQQRLERRPVRPYDMIERLVGMQAQLPLDPYVGLWSRIDGFTTDRLASLLLERRVVRAALMRGTIHLVSARDCLALRPLTQIVQERAYRGGFGKRCATWTWHPWSTTAGSSSRRRPEPAPSYAPCSVNAGPRRTPTRWRGE